MANNLVERPSKLSCRLSGDKHWLMIFADTNVGGKWMVKAEFVWHLKEGYTDANALFVVDKPDFVARAKTIDGVVYSGEALRQKLASLKSSGQS